MGLIVDGADIGLLIEVPISIPTWQHSTLLNTITKARISVRLSHDIDSYVTNPDALPEGASRSKTERIRVTSPVP